MSESICIFLEQNYLPKRYKENIEYLFFLLKEKYSVDIFSPDIDLNSNYKNNLIEVIDNKKISVKTSATHKYFYDMLIIFSDFNKKLTFDRRLLIIRAISHKRLITISGYKPFIFNSPQIRNNINLMDNYFYETICYENKIVFDSIFNKIISFSEDEVRKFKKKYDTNKKIIALIPGPIENWNYNPCLYNKIAKDNKEFVEIFLKNIDKTNEKLESEGYEILGIKFFSDDYSLYNGINIKWINETEYNILKYCSSAIISLSNNNFFRYINLNKPIINIGIVPVLYLFKKRDSLNRYLLQTLNYFFKENNYNKILDYADFILEQIKNYKFKDKDSEKIDLIQKIESFENCSPGILINNRI